jgi:hypothetical protein
VRCLTICDISGWYASKLIETQEFRKSGPLMMLLNSKSYPRAAAGLSAAFVIWNSLFTTPQFESGKQSAGDKPDAEVKITAFG